MFVGAPALAGKYLGALSKGGSPAAKEGTRFTSINPAEEELEPASLVLGLVCWTWHLPLFVLPGYFDAFGRAAPTPLDRLYGILQSAQFHPTTCSNRILAPIVDRDVSLKSS